MRNCLVHARDNWIDGGIVLAGVYFHSYRKFPNSSEVGSLTGLSENVDENLHRLTDGGFFVDRRSLPYTSGPMVDYNLPSDAPETHGYVGLGTYLDHWHKFGAKIGKRIGDRMYWSDGTETEIPACECWRSVCVGCGKLRVYVDRAPGGMYATARKVSGPDDHCPACKERLAPTKCTCSDNIRNGDLSSCDYCIDQASKGQLI